MSESSARLLTVAEVARILGVSTTWVRRKVRAGELPAVRLGATRKAPVRVDAEDLRIWLVASNRGRAIEKAVLP